MEYQLKTSHSLAPTMAEIHFDLENRKGKDLKMGVESGRVAWLVSGIGIEQTQWVTFITPHDAMSRLLG